MFKTGIEFLDTQIGSVYPAFIILQEMVGAGGREFAATSLLNNAASDYRLCYLAVTKTEDEVRRDLKLMFPQANFDRLFEKLEVHSLAKYYFKDSIVPLHWIDEKAALDVLRGEVGVLEKLVELFEQIDNCLVFLDSVTDLARAARRASRENLIDLLKGLRSLCAKKNILLMGLLTSNVLDRSLEEEILDQVDGVIVFELVVEKDSITRWMYFRKFMGILPKLESDRVLKYNVKLDPAQGFTISRVMRIL